MIAQSTMLTITSTTTMPRTNPCRAEIVNETKTNNAIDDRNERSAWRMRFHVGLHYLVANTPKHDHHPEQEIVASCFA